MIKIKKTNFCVFLLLLFFAQIMYVPFDFSQYNDDIQKNNYSIIDHEVDRNQNLVDKQINSLIDPKSSAIKSKWTILVYMDGDNNLESAAIEDLNELESVGSTTEVNFLVQLDRIASFDESNGDWTDTRRYFVEKDNSQTLIGNSEIIMEEQNMGSQESLENFIDWGQTEYPAENYALILWDHGSGIMAGSYSGGICWDDTNNFDYLTEEEIKNAINEKGIDILGMDACLMASTEFWYGLSEHVSYFIGSEENEPGDGWPYETTAQWIIDNPDATPEEFSAKIVDLYSESYEMYEFYGISVTQSAIDAQELIELGYNINLLTEELSSAIEIHRANIELIRENLFEYGGSPYIDLKSFIEYLISFGIFSSISQNLINQIDNVVINSKYTGSLSQSNGLSIYFPKTASDFSNSYRNNYFCFNSSWDEFLLNYYNAPSDDDQFEDNDIFENSKLLHYQIYSNLVCQDNDFYKIEAKSGDNLSINLAFTFIEDSANLDVFLFYENETLIDSTFGVLYDNKQLRLDVSENVDLIIKINNSYGGSNLISYTLSIIVPIEDDDYDLGLGNDNFQYATDLNDDLNKTIPNLVCIDSDYYNFTVTEGDALVSINIGYQANFGILNLEIYQIKDNNPVFMAFVGSADDNAVYQFGSSDPIYNSFCFVVNNYENNTNYSITVMIDYFADDIFDSAGLDNDYVNKMDTVNFSDGFYSDLVCLDNDFYNISLDSGDWLNATIYFLQIEGDLDLYLYDSDGYQIDSSYFWENDEMITFYCQETGNYSLWVYPKEINLHYNLSIITNESYFRDEFDGSNELWEQKDDFPNIPVSTEPIENLSALDVDWYAMDLIAKEEYVFSIVFDNENGTLVLFLYDESKNLIRYSFTTKSNEYIYYIPDEDGTYYLEIVPYQRLEFYDLIITIEPEYTAHFEWNLIDSLTVQFEEDGVNSPFIDYYYWDFGDDTYYSGEMGLISHVYEASGYYTPVLYVVTHYNTYEYHWESIRVYSEPESGFSLYLNSTSPLSNGHVSLYWDPILNADNLSIFYSFENSSSLDDWNLLQSDNTGLSYGISFDLQVSGRYYFLLVYDNPLGTGLSNTLMIDVIIGTNANSTNTIDPSDTNGFKISNYDVGLLTFMLFATTLAITIKYYIKQKKH